MYHCVILGESRIEEDNCNNCVIIGPHNYIPANANNCTIIGSNIQLNSNDIINDVVYFSGKPHFNGNEEDYYYKLFKKVEDHIEKITGQPFVYNGQYYDVIARLEEIEKRLTNLDDYELQK